MHLIGVISSYEGSGTNSSYPSVSEGDDTLGCAACEMGRGALIVMVDESPREEEGSKDENKEKEDKSCICRL